MKYKKSGLLDVGKVSKLLVKGFNIGSSKEGKEIFLKERKRDTFIIAEENGQLHGLISWGIRGVPKHQLVRIARICIVNSKKKNEVAIELLREATQEADKFFKKKNLKLRKMYAMVRSTNKKLKDFYKKMGFVEEAKLKDHYYKGKDEFIFSLFFE